MCSAGTKTTTGIRGLGRFMFASWATVTSLVGNTPFPVHSGKFPSWLGLRRVDFPTGRMVSPSRSAWARSQVCGGKGWMTRAVGDCLLFLVQFRIQSPLYCTMVVAETATIEGLRDFWYRLARNNMSAGIFTLQCSILLLQYWEQYCDQMLTISNFLAL